MNKSSEKKIHIAISVRNLGEVVQDYTNRLGTSPEVLIEDEYALWRTESVNLSLRVDGSVPSGTLRHLGFEDSSAKGFTSTIDSVGIEWEHFRAEDQLAEINELWPGQPNF